MTRDTGQMEKLNANFDFDGVDPELAWHLLDLHWNRQHHAFMVTYRPAFMRDMATGGPYSLTHLTERHLFRRQRSSVPGLSFAKCQPMSGLLAGSSGTACVICLVRRWITAISRRFKLCCLCATRFFALGDEPSAAWIYAGNAFRMIIDLGLHVDVTSRSNLRHLTDEDIEIRRRVFWAAFG